MRVTSITPMKDEGPFVLEWLAYHRLIGVNDPIVFTNHCSDGTDLMLERLDEMGLVRHIPNPSTFTGSDHHHWQIINYTNEFPRLRRSDWVTYIDADEFICVNSGEGHLTDLFAAVPDANVISMNQLNFGCAGVRKFSGALQIAQFDRCQPDDVTHTGRQNRRGVKTLTHQSAPTHRFSNHSPILDLDRQDAARWVNGGGEAVDITSFEGALKSLPEGQFNFALVQLNHYALRSMECFLVQSARGNANHADPVPRLKYWRKYNQNGAENTAIQRWNTPVQDQINDWLRDPELRALHDQTLDHYRAKIAALRADDAYHKLFMKALRAHNASEAEQETAPVP